MFKMSSAKKTLFATNRILLVCLLLVGIILAVYWNLSRYEFINYDDNIYLSENQQIQSGLTKESLAWSFNLQENKKFYWHPLTWISHMLDVELYGMDPGRHHLTNVIIHVFNTLLLFLILNRMTGALWRCAFVAALFALHPINVESVAWIAERKNVLSTFFGLLALWIYAGYARRPGLFRYLGVALFFVLSLLAKPMLVTLPFVLLLLDYWPLKRIEFQQLMGGGLDRAGRLIVEKVPLFILSVLSVYLSMASTRGIGNVISLQAVPLMLRIENTLVSYIKYIGKLIWPSDLAIFYPYPEIIPLWQLMGALAVLCAISIVAIRSLRNHPYIAVGWLLFLGTLVPVIGLVQVGRWQEMADRFAYVPLIGLFVIIAWGIPHLVNRWQYKRIGLTIGACVLLLVLAVTTRSQVRHWEDSVTIFQQAVKATGGSWIAHNNLANGLMNRNKNNEAIRHFRLALQGNPPEPAGVYFNLAVALTNQGRNPEAIECYAEVLKLAPEYVNAHINMGAVLDREGRTDEAINHFLEALRIEPNSDKAHFNLGNTLLAKGRLDEAINHFSNALRLNPNFAEAHNSTGLALMQKGKLEEAIRHFRKAADIKPAYRDAEENKKLAESIDGKIKNAAAGMRDSMNFNLQDPEIGLKMVDLLEKKKALDQVLTQFSMALSLQPGFTSLDFDRISIVLDIKKQYESKLAQFHAFVERWPDNAAADYHIACIYSRRGQADDAIQWLNQAIQKGFNRLDLIETDSDLNGVRGLQDFQVLIKGQDL
jgi:tetratricopeptide (TPR) repeat protein